MADIFISHVEEEKRIASAVERCIAEILEPCPAPSIFLSSNIFKLVGGEKFEDRITKELHDCRIFIAMCSDLSFSKHWVHIETGAAWAMGKPVVPVCYGGKDKGNLPRPYSSFHAINLDDDLYNLIIAVSQQLALMPPPPPPFYITGEKWSRGYKIAEGAYEQVAIELLKMYPPKAVG
jgi:hypothetical protein